MKTIAKSRVESQELDEQLTNEILIMENLKHKNVIRLETYFEDHRNLYMVMELADSKNLYARLQERQRFSESEAADVRAAHAGRAPAAARARVPARPRNRAPRHQTRERARRRRHREARGFRLREPARQSGQGNGLRHARVHRARDGDEKRPRRESRRLGLRRPVLRAARRQNALLSQRPRRPQDPGRPLPPAHAEHPRTRGSTSTQTSR